MTIPELLVFLATLEAQYAAVAAALRALWPREGPLAGDVLATLQQFVATARARQETLDVLLEAVLGQLEAEIEKVEEEKP